MFCKHHPIIAKTAILFLQNDDVVKVNGLKPQCFLHKKAPICCRWYKGRHYAHSTMPLYPISSQRFLNKMLFFFNALYCSSFVFSSVQKHTSLVPRPHSEKGLVTLAIILVCAVSAVFVSSRGITFVHYQLLNS